MTKQQRRNETLAAWTAVVCLGCMSVILWTLLIPQYYPRKYRTPGLPTDTNSSAPPVYIPGDEIWR